MEHHFDISDSDEEPAVCWERDRIVLNGVGPPCPWLLLPRIQSTGGQSKISVLNMWTFPLSLVLNNMTILTALPVLGIIRPPGDLSIQEDKLGSA